MFPEQMSNRSDIPETRTHVPDDRNNIAAGTAGQGRVWEVVRANEIPIEATTRKLGPAVSAVLEGLDDPHELDGDGQDVGAGAEELRGPRERLVREEIVVDFGIALGGHGRDQDGPICLMAPSDRPLVTVRSRVEPTENKAPVPPDKRPQ